MSDWIARYEEGYVTAEGETVTVSAELHRELPWRSPDEAIRHWSMRPDLSGSNVRQVGNGIEQTESVSNRPEFSTLFVVSIWRRVTFERNDSRASLS
jgi:hypothetical protein